MTTVTQKKIAWRKERQVEIYVADNRKQEEKVI